MRFFALACAALGLLFGHVDVFAAGAQPNIVLLIADDQDYEHLGFMGNPVVETPNLDRLANAGTIFTHAHVPMSRCYPVLASLLSGRWPHQTGVYANYGTPDLDPANSLAGLLRDAGYATYAEGKYLKGSPRQMGFTHGRGRSPGTFVRAGQQGLFEFIDEVAGKKPFFVWWAPKLPHRPHDPPQRYLDRFSKSAIPIPEYIDAAEKATFLEREHLSLAMVAWLDDGVGQLEQALRDRGAYQNTLFVFVIDNGWSNGRVSKGSPYEKGVRTPIFFTWPAGIAAEKRQQSLTSALDIYPTLLDYAGVPVPSDAAGRSLRPILEGSALGQRQSLFGAIYPAFASKPPSPERDAYAFYARDSRWKAIFFVRDVVAEQNHGHFRIQAIATEYPERRAGDVELYDLANDPYEIDNLAADVRHAARIEAMRGDVVDWWARTGGEPIATLAGVE